VVSRDAIAVLDDVKINRHHGCSVLNADKSVLNTPDATEMICV
jgi:hypothetical protein